MLALLNYVQSLLGKRNLVAFIVLAALSATALELTSLARNAFETFIQKQAATFAEQKAKGEADVATATAREKEAQAQLAAEVAANAKFRQLAEAQLAGAGAREKEFQAQLAAEVAANAKFRQLAEAQLAQASAREKEAMAITAAAIASNSPERQRAEARKAIADADLAAAKAVQEAVIAKAFNPNFRTSQEAAAAEGSGKRTQPVSPADGVRAAFETKIRTVDRLAGGTDNPASAQNASAASDNVGRRMYEVNLCAADRLMGHKSIFDGLLGCKEKPAEQQPAPRDSIGGRMFDLSTSAANRLAGGTGDPAHDGIFAKPETQAADAHDKQIEQDCKRRLARFDTMKDHAAIAVTPNGGCSWTAGQPTKQVAVAVVMNQCAKANVKTCSIALAR
jgi:hypothetical protein